MVIATHTGRTDFLQRDVQRSSLGSTIGELREKPHAMRGVRSARTRFTRSRSDSGIEIPRASRLQIDPTHPKFERLTI